MKQLKLGDIGEILRAAGSALELQQGRKPKNSNGHTGRHLLHERQPVLLLEIERLGHEHIHRGLPVAITLGW